MYGLKIKFSVFSVVLIAFGCRPPSNINGESVQDRIYGMLMGAAVADAMAGPHEGRSTEASQFFWTKEGGSMHSIRLTVGGINRIGMCMRRVLLPGSIPMILAFVYSSQNP
jgi:hypothetical protein